MSRPDDRPVNLARAVRSHLLHAARHLVVATDRRGATPHQVALRRYFAEVGRRMGRDPHRFRVVGSAPVSDGEGQRIVEVTLSTSAQVHPGDMLAVTWRNADDVVARHLRGADGAVRYWTTPRPCRPSRPARGTPAAVLRDVLDLSVVTDGAPSPAATPRIAPRIYTASAATTTADGRSEVRLLVSRHAAWPDRAAAFLHRLSVGDVVEGWVLPHPHRLPPLLGHDGPGVAVVTGSGAAGVLAALRAGTLTAPARLVWGTRYPVEAWLLDELQSYRADGALDRLEVVSSAVTGRRVTHVLDTDAADLARRTDGGWVYVSGHAASAAPVRERFVAAAGPGVVARMADELRYVESV